MADICKRISASVSSLVDKAFNRKKPSPGTVTSRVECIYGPPEMLAERRARRIAEINRDPEPEPVDLYGPPLAGEEEPEDGEAAQEDEPMNAGQVQQAYPVVIPDEPTCIYGPPPAR